MSDWIPTSERLPEDEEWVIVQTQDGTVYPCYYKKNVWTPIFRGGDIQLLNHGKASYWMPHPDGYPYVRCDHGHFYLKTKEGMRCPTCVSIGFDDEKPVEKPKRPRKAKEEPLEPIEEVPFSEPVSMEDDLAMLLEEEP